MLTSHQVMDGEDSELGEVTDETDFSKQLGSDTWFNKQMIYVRQTNLRDRFCNIAAFH